MIELAIIYQMEFNEWINAQFMKWQGKKRRTISEFAIYLGVKQPALSMWMKEEKGSKPDYKNAAKIATRLGPEVFEILGLPPPDLPTDEQLRPIAELILQFPEKERLEIREKIVEYLTEIIQKSQKD